MTHTTLQYTLASAAFALGLSLQTLPAQAKDNKADLDDAPTASASGSPLGPAVYGDKISLGAGHIRTFTRHYQNGTPYAIGVRFPGATLKQLPTEPNDGLNCWDLNADNRIDLHDECSGGHNRSLFFGKNNTPFQWISVDWEPHGHVPEDIYGARHFDFHFYMTGFVERNQIAVGPCMPGTINCAQHEVAVRPVAAQYLHPDFFNTNLAFSRMGNHWADRTSPEFHGQPFTQTFILGSYDSKITFYEPMVSLDYLLSKPNQCHPVKQPAKFQSAGYYPTEYCIRHNSATDVYTVSLQKFVRRAAN
ncbi:hypothetical protein [Azohydromonas lata]|uniref:hypothetical protein n=1 Tax=Azohydromonas lata TaxID=45677 RepID=UPI00083083A5|nr:hypothetical protein [Azohydromonas lata]